MLRPSCAHCGFPVTAAAGAQGPLYCCHGCRLVSSLVGRGQPEGERAWELLRLGIGALLSMEVMMVSLLLYSGEIEAEMVPALRFGMLGLSIPAVGLLGYPFARAAQEEVRQGRPSLDTLVACGALASFALSAAATLQGEGPLYFDTATMLLTLMSVGKLIESAARKRTTSLLNSLESLLPPTALRLEPHGPTPVPLEALRPGDLLRVPPGERFPVDGHILEGHTRIEEALFTGDAWPSDRSPGDPVRAGAVNGAGAVVVQAQQVGAQLLLRRMISLIEGADFEPGKAERLSQRLATWMVTLVLLLAFAAALFWLVVDGAPMAGRTALSVLAVGCPCAMALAAPLATSLAIARAARQGVVVRGGAALERLGTLRTVFFDKTGTLTAGKPELSALQSLDEAVGEGEVLQVLASLEAHAGYAPAAAIVQAALARGVALGEVHALEVLPGLGLRGQVKVGGLTREVAAGSDRLALSLCPGGQLGPPPEDGQSAIYLCWGGAVRGRALIRDQLRDDAGPAVRELHQAGIATALLSGDRLEVASAVARQVGIPTFQAPCLPDEKARVVRDAAAQGLVAMAGDGLNDGPALAAAGVGIAVAAQGQLARNLGQVVLLHGGLRHIPWVVKLSRRTRALIAQNLAWAVAYNAIALGAAASGWLPPLLAAAAMVLSSLSVMGNSLRLRSFPDPGPLVQGGIP